MIEPRLPRRFAPRNDGEMLVLIRKHMCFADPLHGEISVASFILSLDLRHCERSVAIQ
jgi:hypothetical protein